MPFAPKASCSSCNATDSSLWRKSPDGQVLCNTCALSQLDGITFRENGNTTGEGLLKGKDLALSSHLMGPLRKSARIKPSKYKFQTAVKPLATKGKSRRVIFKKNPIKAATTVSTVVTSDYIFYDGQYWQLGDIVSVMDDDGGIYYAQIRGFLKDQYCQKSAVITWLLPTLSSPRDRFDPATYIIGPEEDIPRNMEVFEFVMHAPSEYYKSNTSPYPTLPTQPELGYVWTSLGPEIRPVPSREEIYGLREMDSEKPAGTEAKGRGKGEDKRKKKEPKEKKERKNVRDRGRAAKAAKVKEEAPSTPQTQTVATS